MQLPQDWEHVVQERIRSWETEIQQRQLWAQLPRQPPLWRRLTSSGLVRAGTLLMRWGERLAQRERRRGVSVAG